MDKEIIIKVNDTLLEKQARTLTEVINLDDKIVTPKQKEHLEGIWEMCHCILDKCEEW